MDTQTQQGHTLNQSNSAERVGTIFLVDDEPMVTVSLQTMLSLETRHLIYSFNSPMEALDKLTQYRPDVIISDFSMPDMDGIRFLQRAKEILPQATLILLTGYADKESAIEAINTVGIYRYIEKPWDNEELKLNIKNGLERAHLVSDLRDTIHQLTEAESQLRETNQHLEALVESRTQDLQATYQKLQSLVQNSADGIITLNANLEITSINPTAEHWIREAMSFATPNAIPKQITLSNTSLFKTPNGEALDTILASMEHATLLIQEAYLGAIPLEINVSSLTGVDPGLVLMMRNITQRKEVERLRDDFVSTLTHDLRTPLAASIQTLNFFMDGTVSREDHEKREQLTEMLIQSHRDMLGLVNVLLEVYKYEAGRQRLVFDRLHLGELVGTVCQELHALAASREQHLTHSIAETSASVIADKQEIKRVLVNLIGNAIHHTPTGGNIHVALTEEASAHPGHPGNLTVMIQDNGRGIPQKDLALLFNRFSQGTSTKRSSGSGLGLYLSRQIIDAHQGKIWVDSQEGQGSRFYVSLPIHS